MIHFDRPTEPTGFQDRVKQARADVEQAIAAGDKPAFEPEIWRDQTYKEALATAQARGKCGFCDRNATNHSPAIDHFAPKGEVWELPPTLATAGGRS